ncbi:hypothetical protein [Kitasatospora griseola]|uniref:hypothetical protein n=1 Tax=Kitasatospora griseola TaxID=2064 RepID=UPI003415C887
MGSVEGRRASGCGWVSVWVLAALVLATAGVVCGNAWVDEAWHWCLTQDHEPDPTLAAATRSVWVVMFAVLLVCGAVLSRLPRSRWYLLPAMSVVAAVLVWLYVTGMGSPAPLRPGDPEEAACWTMRTFPFLG